jgi:hypothetical protein
MFSDAFAHFPLEAYAILAFTVRAAGQGWPVVEHISPSPDGVRVKATMGGNLLVRLLPKVGRLVEEN